MKENIFLTVVLSAAPPNAIQGVIAANKLNLNLLYCIKSCG